ncbi:hypothetical protein HMPREF9392_1942 [Streptococcus sanguinis SK678]|nr:hypothetical protein HMPREF9392_1942 [Streptococcus sanguinis SK678]
MIHSTSDGDYFSYKMNYQSILRLEYFKILTNASIRTLEWFNILTNRIK